MPAVCSKVVVGIVSVVPEVMGCACARKGVFDVST